MKLRFFVLLTIMVLGGYGMTSAQSISLDHTDGLIDATHLDTGVPVTFYIRVTGDDTSHAGITNAFRVYSDDGATWDTTVGAWTGTLGPDQFDGGMFIKKFSITGSGADTVGFGAFRFFESGLVAGFDDVAITLDIGPIAQSEIGKTICLDSTFYPPSGVWKWAVRDVFPDWSGPHCFTVGPPPACEVVVTAPAGGETWESGTLQTITYQTTNCENCDNIDISYSVDGGAFTAISTGSTNTGTFSWTVPEVESSNVIVRVCCAGSLSHCGGSGVFSIVAPALPEIVSVDPNSAAQCDEGLVVTITGANTDWQGSQGSEVVYLQHSSGAPIIMGSSVSVTSPTSVQATFNFAYDIATGLYDVTVDASLSGPVTLEDGFTVNAAAASNIVVSPADLNFDAEVCDPDLDDQSFTITSEICRHSFNLSIDVGWVGVSVMGGTTPAEVIVSVDTTGLGAGTHIGTITVTAPGALNSPQTVSVTLVVPETPAPGGLEMNARILAMSASGWQDGQTVFGTGNAATDCYDAGIDEFEPPAPPGSFVRAYFNHPEWGELQNEFNSDIRSTFSTLCKDYVLTVQTNVAEEITLSIPAIVNPGCYKISLLNPDGSTVLVDNFETDSFTFLGSATHVFRIRVCAGGGGISPTITCPEAPIDEFICAPGPVCIDLPIADATTVLVEGATWEAGRLCFDATAAGLYSFDVTAENPCGSDFCRVEINVTVGEEPVIDCPQTELAAERCGPGQVCVPLAITGAETVTVEGATWADGQLCFDAPTSDAYGFQVIAVNDCGEDTCDVLVNVTINDVPVIDCPQEPIAVMIAPGETCVPLAITGATSVTVESGDWTASWAEGQFCFDASVLGEFGATITATNDCGEVTCPVTIIVQDCPLPVVDCPAEPIPFDACQLEGVHFLFPVAVTGATEVTVTGGATWTDNTVSFMPDTFGTYEFTLTATNECGSVECAIVANVIEIPAVVIECPAEPLQYIFCGPLQVCHTINISNADEVSVSGGATWVEGEFCFNADTAGSYVFEIVATNQCGADTCFYEAGVGFHYDPTACFTADPTEGPVPLNVTFSNCSDIDTDNATYLWDFNDGTTSTEMNPVHTFEQIGCYDVSLTVTDNCGRTSTAMQTICVLDDQVVIPTDRWINIYCPEPMLEGIPLSPGDYITAYDPDGVLCGMGEVQPDGSYGMILIYADDIYTADVDEGAEVGDLISIRINGVPVATDPTIIWTENGAVFMVCNFTAETCMTFDLDAGWHLISWNVAYSGDILELIGDFAECVDVVLSFDRGGLTYDPTLPEFSTLNSVDFYHGYWLRLSCPVTFDICGGIISPNDYINIYSGWNLVSYWPDDILPVEDALASLLADDNLLVAYGYDGGASDYIPGDPMHQSLTDLAPGFGYWVKTRWDAMLTYPGFVMPPVAAPRADNQRSLVASSGVTPSRSWMSIYGSDLEIDGQPVRSGATVEVLTHDGVVCGSGVYNDGILKFTSVYGYDAENDSYPKNGDRLELRIDGQPVASELTYAGNGSRISLGSLSASDLLPNSYSMSQNYPNPFNPSTTISFNLPNTGQVQLSIYNVLGQKVTTLVNGQYTAGTHEVTWNGTDDSGSPVGSGIYFYRITSSDFDQTKKMILMK